MRIFLHDFGGYAFAVELARELANRGHETHFRYFGSIAAPSGAVYARPDDPSLFDTRSISLGRQYHKYSFVRRRTQDALYGTRVAAEIEQLAPDVVISSNTPLDAQKHISRAAAGLRIPFVFWLQDLISIAVRKLAEEKIPLLGSLVAAYYEHLESRLLRKSDLVLYIADTFLPEIHRLGVEAEKCVRFENWAPLKEIELTNSCNAWRQQYGLENKRILLYSGTLGLKHNPRLFLRLADEMKTREDIAVVVISEGLGAEYLKQELAKRPRNNLLVLPFQPYSRLSEVLASAHILLAFLERDASSFSVPSKVLTYLCAGRPIQLSIPLDNPAAAIIRAAQAGFANDPADWDGLVSNIGKILDDGQMYSQMSESARAYAEQHFAIGAIAQQFEQLCNKLVLGKELL